MKYGDIPEDKKAQLDSILDFAEHIVIKFKLEQQLGVGFDEIVELVEFFLPIGAEDFLDISDHVSDLEETFHRYHGMRGVYIPDGQGAVQLLYKCILEEFYIFYGIEYSKEDIAIPSKQSFDITEDERYGLVTPRYCSATNKPSQGDAFVRHVIKKFNLSEWFNSLSYDDIFDAIMRPIENPEHFDDVAGKIHYIEDALYTLAKKKAIFIPYPKGEMNRTFYLLLEEYYNYFGIPYTDDEINVPNSWTIDGHAIHREYIKEVME